MTMLQVTSGSGITPESAEGRSLFADFLGADETAVVQTFAHSTPPGHPTEKHVHTADVAAYVVRGNLRIGSGAGYADVLEVGPGDYLFIPQGSPHLEEVIGDEEVVFVVAHLRGFHTLSAGE